MASTGCAGSDAITVDGNVYDSDRLMYLRNIHHQRATGRGHFR
jgi:hypothetical protein